MNAHLEYKNTSVLFLDKLKAIENTIGFSLYYPFTPVPSPLLVSDFQRLILFVLDKVFNN